MYYSALIGRPVEHSVSPLMYEAFAATSGLEYRHLKVDVAPDALDTALRALQTLGFIGANVTLPYKQDVQPFLDRLDESAAACGAVNTITMHDSELVGYNTDWMGITGGLRAHGTEHANNAVIFGSGGAARAAIYALKQMGSAHIDVLYREPVDDKTMSLAHEADQLGIRLRPYTDLENAVSAADVICNMTSTGMKGQPDTPFELSRLDSVNLGGKTFLDAVFNPVETPQLRYFADRGLVTVDGLWMMLYQGIGAFEHWTNCNLSLSTEHLAQIHQKLKEAVDHD